MVQRVMTADDFVEQRSELPDAGQWAELIRGVPVAFPPPDLEHGNIVLNLSKAFSEYVHRTLIGYACFDLGLHVERRPDTVFFPAVSYFTSGERFSEMDKEVTESVPAIVIELLTTNERRRSISERTGVFQRHGVETIWLIDPSQRIAHVIRKGGAAPRRLSETDLLTGDNVLPGFSVEVGSLFAVPDWAAD
ncbi:Uma2 family endonuclease [Planctomicrobium piriforme]|uniref:Endonuclease, Uma2 family (Restriction endonuclease fold) n=1 Tax=Planctomicrobium piriforme TaxID=1576369 RepID=A0A1I3BZ27_9PLAN|nr:Uma2 family endonuclease [Planctomicrobium piriforme]SFH67555.1 Endonuclease, Uma2 family (restriction endonuclease fold) [Planctomicrobium piriforme]